MKSFIRGISNFQLALWGLIVAYAGYFSYLTILRYQTLYAYYLDLGIMHQTVFNTYRAITNLDFSRVLEMIEPFGIFAVKRMAIHNDILLALLAPFYFVYDSPATLLVIQAVTLALGAWFVFKIGQIIFAKVKQWELLSFAFAAAYLLYPPLQKANYFDFHAVTLATTLLLAMFYFWLKKRYLWSFVFIVLALLSKEQVGLTIAFFGIYTLFFVPKSERNRAFSLWTIIVSLTWFALSVFVIIPYFRGGGEHFALEYYGGLGSFPTILDRLFRPSTWSYLLSLFGPVNFLSLLSPLQLLIAAPEFGINLLSANPNLRNIYYHYTSVITPFVFISALYGARFALNKFKQPKTLIFWLAVFSLGFAYFQGPLPFARQPETKPFTHPFPETTLAQQWAVNLKDESLKISTSGKLAPYFASRRYFYNFSQFYEVADYVVILPAEVYNYSVRESLVPAYEALQSDSRFSLFFKQGNFEVYKKL